MRLGPFFVVLFVMYITMGLIDATLNPSLQGYGNGDNNVFLAALTQPWTWQGNDLIIFIESAFGILFIGAIALSTVSKSDIATLAPLASGFFALGAIPLVALYSFITRNVGMFIADCTPGLACMPANIIGALTVGVISLMFIFTICEWWFWRNMTQ
jgi:hypothetical protein